MRFRVNNPTERRGPQGGRGGGAPDLHERRARDVRDQEERGDVGGSDKRVAAGESAPAGRTLRVIEGKARSIDILCVIDVGMGDDGLQDFALGIDEVVLPRRPFQMLAIRQPEPGFELLARGGIGSLIPSDIDNRTARPGRHTRRDGHADGGNGTYERGGPPSADASTSRSPDSRGDTRYPRRANADPRQEDPRDPADKRNDERRAVGDEGASQDLARSVLREFRTIANAVQVRRVVHRGVLNQLPDVRRGRIGQLIFPGRRFGLNPASQIEAPFTLDSLRVRDVRAPANMQMDRRIRPRHRQCRPCDRGCREEHARERAEQAGHAQAARDSGAGNAG